MPGVAPTCSSGHRLIQRSFPTDAPTPSRPTSNQHRFVQSSNPGCWNGNHEGRKGFPAVATGVESSGLIEPCPSVRERPALARRCAPKPVTPTFRIPTSRRRRHAPHPSFRRKPESTSPPTATPLEGPDGNQTSPKNHPNQTNHSSRPSAPHPSFRRKPESTSPPHRNPLEGPDGNQTSPKNHSNQTNHSSRPSAPHQPPHNHPHPSFRRNPEPNSTLRTPNSEFPQLTPATSQPRMHLPTKM